MAKADKDGNVNIKAFFHETIYNELFEAKTEAHKRAKKRDPANVGKAYSWGTFFREIYKIAKDNGFNGLA